MGREVHESTAGRMTVTPGWKIGTTDTSYNSMYNHFTDAAVLVYDVDQKMVGDWSVED